MLKDRALTIRLPRDLYEQLQRRSDDEDRTVASLIRVAAKRYLDETQEADRG